MVPHLGAFSMSMTYLQRILGSVLLPTDSTWTTRSLGSFLFFGLLIHSTGMPEPLYWICTPPKFTSFPSTLTRLLPFSNWTPVSLSTSTAEGLFDMYYQFKICKNIENSTVSCWMGKLICITLQNIWNKIRAVVIIIPLGFYKNMNLSNDDKTVAWDYYLMTGTVQNCGRKY